MTTQRIVRICAYDPINDPGARLRFEFDPDWGNAVLQSERVLPEQLLNPDARQVEGLDCLELSIQEVRFVRDAAAELLIAMEAEQGVAVTP